MLDAAPPDLVVLAHDAGFEAVGLRIGAGGPGEQPWPMTPGSPMLAETLARLADTGMTVQDVEIITITADTRADRYDSLFEAGAQLGARFFNVMVTDPDITRAHETFAAVCERARPYGLRACMEGMSYMSVRDLRTAGLVLAGTGGGLIVDPLHLQRAGDGVTELRAVDPATLGYLQLCDGPLRTPESLIAPRRMPRGQPVGDDVRRIEARAARLLPGEGEIPVAAFAAALPADLPVSVEAPNHLLLAELGPMPFLRRARLAARHVLDEAAGAGLTPTADHPLPF
jgi:sugar phosphate isomerase/epimerase